MKVLQRFSVAAALSVMAASASAATCTTPVALGVQPSVDCHLGTTGQGGSGNDAPSFLNGEGVFSQTDWEIIAKDNDLDGTDEGNAAAMTVTGSLTSGGISIADFVFDTYSKVAVVLKSGNGVPAFWVAYEVQKISGDYDYVSIFLNSNNGKQKDLSHISLYGAGKMSAVPLPAGGLLLLTGLGAFVIRRKRG